MNSASCRCTLQKSGHNNCGPQLVRTLNVNTSPHFCYWSQSNPLMPLIKAPCIHLFVSITSLPMQTSNMTHHMHANSSNMVFPRVSSAIFYGGFLNPMSLNASMCIIVLLFLYYRGWNLDFWCPIPLSHPVLFLVQVLPLVMNVSGFAYSVPCHTFRC